MLSGISALLVIYIIRIVPFLSTWFGLFANSSPEWYMQSYYNTINTFETEQVECDGIVILDLSQGVTRRDVGDLIQLVSENSPKVVGVDCVFSQSQSYDSLQTKYLIQSLSHLPNNFPIVFAFVFDEESVLPDSLMKHKGFVNFMGFYDYQTSCGELSHLAVEMAHVAGFDVSKIDSASFLVNYRAKKFLEVPIMTDFREYADYICESVRGKCVLIGRTGEKWDEHMAPFFILKEKQKIPGTYIVAYALSSIITATSNGYFKNVSNRHYHYYSQCTWMGNALFTILFILLYLGGYRIIDNWQDKQPLLIWLKPVLMLLIIVLMMAFSMILTATCYIVPNVVLFMVMLAFVSYFYDMCKSKNLSA